VKRAITIFIPLLVLINWFINDITVPCEEVLLYEKVIVLNYHSLPKDSLFSETEFSDKGFVGLGWALNKHTDHIDIALNDKIKNIISLNPVDSAIPLNKPENDFSYKIISYLLVICLSIFLLRKWVKILLKLEYSFIRRYLQSIGNNIKERLPLFVHLNQNSYVHFFLLRKILFYTTSSSRL